MDPRFSAEAMRVASTSMIDASSRVIAEEITIEDDVVIGPSVTIQAQQVHIGRGSRVSAGVSVLFVEEFRLGPLATIERDCTLRGRTMRAGAHLYIGERTIIGGGGAMTPGAQLTLGDGTSIFSECYVNLAEPVTIGSRSALSSRVTILTHGCWQPVLDGYPSAFAPVDLGDDVVVYYGSTILPGCRVGDGTLVAASAVVTTSLPARCLAAGTPARVVRHPYPEPLSDSQRRERLDAILATYVQTLAYKGFTDVRDRLSSSGELHCRFDGQTYAIVVGAPRAGHRDAVQIALMLEPYEGVAPDEGVASERTALFDLAVPSLVGFRDGVVEDVRDHLRRTGIRILDAHPFRSLPPAARQRLEARRRSS
jgi:acetyltransferase-like isoleucine patch superfamily enzyme